MEAQDGVICLPQEDSSSDDGDAEGWRFSVASYNVLADKYVSYKAVMMFTCLDIVVGWPKHQALLAPVPARGLQVHVQCQVDALLPCCRLALHPTLGFMAGAISLLPHDLSCCLQAKHYRSYLYHDVPSGYLDWAHRRSAIIAELTHLQPDIICLQEVDRFDDLEDELQQLG